MNRWVLVGMLAVGLQSAGGDRPEPSRGIRAESAYVRLIDQVDVPSQAAGVLSLIAVREGAIVSAESLLANLDDVDAALAVERAQFDLDVARRQAENQALIEAARTAISEAESARDKARLEEDIARQKAESDITVRYSRKAATVAQAELERAVAARKEVRDSISQNEIDHLQLALDKATLETEQAEHDQRVAALQSRVKHAEVGGLELALRRKELDLKQAAHEQEIAVIGQRVREHDLTVARRELERRRIKAPLDGVVVQIHRRKGEWVEPGEKVLRILRLDRLRAEGFVQSKEVRRDLVGLPARVTVTLPDKGKADFQGTVVFVSPEIDPVNGQVLVWAEVDNPAPDFVLRPGMRATMSIELPADGRAATKK